MVVVANGLAELAFAGGGLGLRAESGRLFLLLRRKGQRGSHSVVTDRCAKSEFGVLGVQGNG